MRWAFGAAGVRKSAIMQNVAESPLPSVSKRVSILFSINGRNDGTKTIMTLTYQLAAKCGPYRQFIEYEVTRDPSLLQSSVSVQFKKFVIEPFIHHPQLNSAGRVLIIIDGLDECDKSRTQRELLQLISDFCSTCPSSPIVWIIASRPEAHITAFFAQDHVKAVYEKEEILIDSNGARDDVEKLLRNELTNIQHEFSLNPQWPPEQDLWKLASAAGGPFVYADTVIKYIGDPDFGNPTSQLNDVLKVIDAHPLPDVRQEEHPMARLDALYAQILCSVPKRGMHLRTGNFLVFCGLAHQYYYPSTLPSSPATASGYQSRGDITLPLSSATPNRHADSGLPSPPPSQSRLHRVRRLHGKSIQEPPKLQEHKIDVEGARVSVPSVNASPRRSIPPGEESPEVLTLATDLAEMGRNPMQREAHTSPSSPLSPRKRPKRVRPPRLEGDLSLPESSGTGTSSFPMNLKLQSPAFRRKHLVEDQPLVGNVSDTGSSTRSTIRGLSTPPTHWQALLIPGNPSPKRTLDLVRNQVAQEMALRVVSKSKLVDGVQVGIADASSASSPDDIPSIHMVAANLASSFVLTSTPYLFIITIATTFGGIPPSPILGILYITTSSQHITERPIQLPYSNFIGRIASSSYTFSSPDQNYMEGPNLGLATREKEWIARIKDLHVSSFDSDILHFALTSASRTPLDPCTPPKNLKSIKTRLADAQAGLQRITPRQAYKELKSNLMDVPTILVDIRTKGEREKFGGVEGSVVVERSDLEWKLDPRSEVRLDIADRYDLRVIVFDQEGVTSSLAAVSLQKLGLLNATDVIGGFGAWKEAMFPVVVAKSRAKVSASRIVR